MQSANVIERRDAETSALSFEGVPLMQLAAVAAARAEGFSLQEVLALEGLDASAYRAADVAYKSQLLDGAARDGLIAEYQVELAQAEDRLSRKVSPLDEDLDAWVRFLGAYSADPAPADWLATLGLKMPDLSRLSRAWKRRLESDDALRQRAERAARDKKPYDVSSLQLAPPKLVASPVARASIALSDKEDAFEPPVKAIPRWRPRSELTREEPIESPSIQLPVQPIVVRSALAETRPVFSIATETLPFAPAPDVPEKPLPDVAIALPPREALSGTSLSLDIPRGPATPFDAASAPAIVDPPMVDQDKPKVIRAPAALAGTSMVVNIPRGPATPFSPARENAIIDEKQIAADKPEVKRAPSELGGTSLALDIPRGPVTPFLKDKPSGGEQENVPEKPIAPDKPMVQRAPAELAGTSFALNIPRGPATPFIAVKESPLVEERPATPPVANTSPREALSGTSLSLDIPRVAATPFGEAEKAAAKVTEPKKDEPKKPALSLEQHASLMVEIATYPAHAMAILARYGISTTQKVELDQHYRAIVANDPKAQAAWHAAYGAHYARIIRR